MIEYQIYERTFEIDYKDREKVKEGFTVFKHNSSTLWEGFDSLDEAREVFLKDFSKSDIEKINYDYRTAYRITEYSLDEVEYDENDGSVIRYEIWDFSKMDFSSLWREDDYDVIRVYDEVEKEISWKEKKSKIREYTLVNNDDRFPVLKEESCRDWYDGRCNYNETAYMLRELFSLDQYAMEKLYIVALAADGRTKGVFLAGQGSADSCRVPYDNIFKYLLLIGADFFVIAHNHPNGAVDFSEGDKRVFEKLKEMGELFRIPCTGSIVIAKEGYRIDIASDEEEANEGE